MKWKHRLYPQGGETYRIEDVCQIHFETHSFAKPIFFPFQRKKSGGGSCVILDVPVNGRKV